eukprot:TRINITY_DN784_c0_g1_i1.p3 TRINITY_DN784_c0_g1~~TRINITY_DN784_c0_g1_i1.p3  ORF type:complete len:130 (-),score=39.33 TRINITY_DN784_c0_g1_i1:263-652(-)
MTYYEGLLFAANSDSIYSMTVDGDGNLGTPNVIFKLSGLLVVLDDLSIVNNGNWIAIAEYLGGRVLIIDRARGSLLCDSGNVFSGPSSVILSQSHFDAGKLVVTEKGILYDMISNIGNRVGQVDFVTSF